MGREIRIGVLAVSTLMAAHNDSLATRTDSLRIVKDAVSSSDLSLSEATVTGSQLPVSLDKAWSKIVVISRQEIDNAKCQTINDILKLCPNVDVRQRGAMGVQTDISLGGGTFDQITFMLNGININNPQTITLNGPDRTFVEDIHVPRQITGYEYQFLACRQALIDGILEPHEMPHAETLFVMELMDTLRQKWGVRYPMDSE